MLNEYMPYIKLGFAALLPVAASAFLYLLDKKTAFGKLNNKVKQVIFGVIFGLLAVVGTEWGIPLNGAQVNCRDAAVMTAGLLFGAPAGIIAGLIGGIERWFAVYWGVGSFTRVACTVSTVIAGFYSAFLRKYMFENKKPGKMIACASGFVMETFHLTMVFITNMATPIEAMYAVKVSTVPMILSNSVSIFLSTLMIEIISKEKLHIHPEKLRISQTIQRWLLLTVVLAFLTTTMFVFNLQSEIAAAQIETSLELSLESTAQDILDMSDKNILDITRNVASDVIKSKIKPDDEYKLNDEGQDEYLVNLKNEYHVAEVSLINKDGIIFRSSGKEYVGFDMNSGEQSREFLCLLGDTKTFVQDFGHIVSDPSIERKYAGIKTEWGFVQVGYDAEMFETDIDSQVVNMTQNRHINKTGYIVIFNLLEDGKADIVSRPRDFSSFEFSQNVGSFLNGENTTFKMVINEKPCYCRYTVAEGYYIFSVLPQEEALQMRNIAVYVNTFMEILVFAILFAIIYFLIKKVVVNKISDVNRSLAKITGGDLSETVDVRSSQEFVSLSDDINSTVTALKHYIDEASARIDKELEFARNIQRSVLPNVYPAFSGRSDFDIYALMDTAKEVGGDFYDFYFTHKHKLNFLIADVSGKGIPAAMFMMRAKTELKRFTEADISTGDVFTNSNAALCEGNDAGMFITAWQAGIELKTGVLEFANAGHNPPLIKKKDGKFEYLKSRAGFVLAGMDGMKYKAQNMVLEKGDILYLYTDGVTEATNADEELYGEERLLSAINSREFESMQELCEFIKEDVDKFVGEAPQFDDITMVAFKYNGVEDEDGEDK